MVFEVGSRIHRNHCAGCAVHRPGQKLGRPVLRRTQPAYQGLSISLECLDHLLAAVVSYHVSGLWITQENAYIPAPLTKIPQRCNLADMLGIRLHRIPYLYGVGMGYSGLKNAHVFKGFPISAEHLRKHSL